jgi:transposase
MGAEQQRDRNDEHPAQLAPPAHIHLSAGSRCCASVTGVYVKVSLSRADVNREAGRSVQIVTDDESSHDTGRLSSLELRRRLPTFALVLPSALQFLIVMLACSINERMQKALDYKATEVVILKEILREVTKKKRIDFTEEQRARLALLGKALSAKERREHCEIAAPKTILDWFRRIYSAKYDSSKSPRRKGRPPKPKEVRELVIQLAQENLSWGYTKIRDVVNKGLQIDICRNTVANILHKAGIVPAPERDKKRTWKQFIRSHWHCLYACDFFNVEVLGVFGAVRYSVFFVIRLETREVQIAGIRVNPNGDAISLVKDRQPGFLRSAKRLSGERVHCAGDIVANLRELLRCWRGSCESSILATDSVGR